MKVLMVGPDRSVHGGISGVVDGYYQAGLDKRINLIYIGTMKEGSKLYKLLVALGAYLHFLCRLFFADIVHVNAASDNSFIRKSLFVKTSHLFQKKIVLHQHGGDFMGWYSGLSDDRRTAVKKIFEMADVCLVLAPFWKEYFVAELGVDEDKILIFPNGIEIPPRPELNVDDMEGYLCKHKKPHQIAFLGRICEAKGIRELISCIPELKEYYPDVNIVLGGIWEDEALKKLADEYPENVQYAGWITGEDKQKLLDESGIFVMPSYFEGQCVAIVEAMAAYCAVVASNTGGIPMMVEDHISGILVEPHNQAALCRALLEVLGDVKLQREMAYAGRNIAEKDYDVRDVVNKLCDIYQALML